MSLPINPKFISQDMTTDTELYEQTQDTIIPTSTNGTLSLTSSSNRGQILTGSAAGFSVVLPDATTLMLGEVFDIQNSSNQIVNLKYNSGSLICLLSPGDTIKVTFSSISTTDGGIIKALTPDISGMQRIAYYFAIAL